MKLEQILIPTKVARVGMTVKEAILECIERNVPAIPFCDEQGNITGRVTLKNVLKSSCLPEYMVELAPVLGDQLACMDDVEAKAKELFSHTVEPYVLDSFMSVHSGASPVKALAMMEMKDTSYVFVIDDGRYKGVVTIRCLAQLLAQVHGEC
jgi:predicted transcriptional regulator